MRRILVLVCGVVCLGLVVEADDSYQYTGCYQDGVTRVMSYQFMSGVSSTYQCYLICSQRGFVEFGVEAGGQCFCNNIIGTYYESESCNMTCASGEICGGVLALSVYRIYDPPGLIYYWPIKSDDTTNSLSDGQLKNITCDGGGSCSFAPDRFNSTHSAFAFSNNNQFGTITDGLTLNASWTITLWFQPKELSNSHYILYCTNDPNTEDMVTISLENGHPYVLANILGSEANIETDYDEIEVDYWYHVAYSVNQDTARLYINGQMIKNNTQVNGLLEFSTCIVGHQNSEIQFDELKIFDHELSQEEVIRDMDGQIVSFQPTIDTTVAIGVTLGRMLVYNMVDGVFLGTKSISCNLGSVNDLIFFNSSVIAGSCSDSKVYFWNSNTLDLLDTKETGLAFSVANIFMVSSSIFATRGKGGYIKLWDTTSLSLILEIPSSSSKGFAVFTGGRFCYWDNNYIYVYSNVTTFIQLYQPADLVVQISEKLMANSKNGRVCISLMTNVACLKEYNFTGVIASMQVYSEQILVFIRTGGVLSSLNWQSGQVNHFSAQFAFPTVELSITKSNYIIGVSNKVSLGATIACWKMDTNNSLSEVWTASSSRAPASILALNSLLLDPKVYVYHQEDHFVSVSQVLVDRSTTNTFTASVLFFSPVDYSITYAWTVKNYQNIDFETANPTNNQSTLTLSGNALDYGSYRVAVTVYILVPSLSPITVSREFTLNILTGITVMVLPNNINSLHVGRAQNLTLSPGKYSIDSDQLIDPSTLDFKFYCQLAVDGQVDYSFPTESSDYDLEVNLTANNCFNDSGSFVISNSYGGSVELYVKPGTIQNLTGGQYYEFIVTTSTQYGFYYQIIKVYGSDQDQVLQPVINPRLPALVVPNLDTLIVSSSNELILQATYLGTASNDSSLHYSWRVYGLDSFGFWTESTPFYMAKVEGNNTNEVFITAEFFTSQPTIQLWNVSLTLNQTFPWSSSSRSSMILQMNKNPYNGSCDVSPSNGSALTTLFTISCEYWDDSDGVVTDYAFYASTGIEMTVSLGRDSNGSLTTLLPVSNTLSLFVYVYDNANGMSVFPIFTVVTVDPPDANTTLQAQQHIMSLDSSSLLYSTLSDLSKYIMSYTSAFYSSLANGEFNETQNVATNTQEVNQFWVNQIAMFNRSDMESIEQAASSLAVITSNIEMINPATATKIVDMCNEMAAGLKMNGEAYGAKKLLVAINNIFEASTNSIQSLNSYESDFSSVQDKESINQERETLNSLTSVVALRLPVQSSLMLSSDSMNMLISRNRLISVPTTIRLNDSQMTFNNSCQLISQSDCSTAILITQAYARSMSLNLSQSFKTHGSRSLSVSFFDDQMNSINVNDFTDGFHFSIKRDSSSSSSFEPFNSTQARIGMSNQLQSFLLELTINASVTIELETNNSTAYLIGVKYGQILVVNSSVETVDMFRVFCPLDLIEEEESLFYRLFVSNPNYERKIGYGLRELTDDEVALYCFASGTTQPTTMPLLADSYNFTSLISIPFSLRVYASSCYFLDEAKTNYSNRGTQILAESNMTFTQCVSTHLTEYAGGLVVLPSTIDFENVFSKADFTQNLTIYLTVIVVSSIYILMFIWCRYMDWKDEKKRAVFFLDDNSPFNTYFYEIIVFTGQRREAGTKSKVSIVMGGVESDSPVRSLHVRKQKILERGSVNSFIMSIEESIGDLNYVKIWHDNSGQGRHASWYLKFLIVHDLQTREKFYFICNDWLAVDKSDGALQRFLPVAMGRQKTELKYLMEKQTKERMSDGHLWYSILARPSESSFSRTDRLTCAFVLLCLTMLMNIMYYDVAKSSSSTNEIVIGPFALSQTQIVIGVITNLVIFPPSFLLLQIFRKSRRRTTRTMKLRNKIEDLNKNQFEDVSNPTKRQQSSQVKKTKPKRRFTLPWWFKIIGYLLSVAIVGVCLFFVLVKGISFGDDQARRWLTSFLVSVLTSIFLTQPLQILLVSVFIIILFRKDDDSNDSEYDPNDDGQPINKFYSTKSKKNSSKDLPLFVRYEEHNEILLAQIKKKRYQENKAWSVIKQTIIYAIFLTVLFLVSYSKTSPHSYNYQAQLQSLLLPNITRVKTTEQIFAWLSDDFVPAVFRTEWYNNKPTTDMSEYITDYTSVLVGNMLLRQARVVTKSCNKLTGIKLCYEDYSVSNYDHKDYGVGWSDDGSSSGTSLDQRVQEAFDYSSAFSINSKPYSGRYTNYLGGGYVFQMEKSSNVSELSQQLQDLETNSWLNKNSRALFIEFTLYNVNLDLFSYCVILFELLPTGSCVSSFMFEPISLYSSDSIVILVFDIVYLFIMVCFVLKEIKLMIKLGTGRYFTHWWSYLDWTLISFSFTAFAMYLCRLYEKWGVSSKIKKSSNSGDQIINFQTLNYWNGLMFVFLGFCCFVASLKLIKIFEFSRTIKMLVLVFRECFKEMANFILIYLILLLAFTQLMYLMVYDRNVQFQSFQSSLVTGFFIMIGKFNVDSFSQDAGAILGPLVYSLFVVSMVVILLNMLINIIIDSFSKIRQENIMQKGREDSLLLAFFKQKVVMPLRSITGRKKKAASVRKNTDPGEYRDTLYTLEQKTTNLAHYIGSEN